MGKKLEIQSDRVIEAINQHPEAKAVLQTLFPEVVEQEKQRTAEFFDTRYCLFCRKQDTRATSMYQIFVHQFTEVRVRNLGSNKIWNKAILKIENAEHKILTIYEFNQLMEASLGKDAHTKVIVIGMRDIVAQQRNLLCKSASK